MIAQGAAVVLRLDLDARLFEVLADLLRDLLLLELLLGRLWGSGLRGDRSRGGCRLRLGLGRRRARLVSHDREGEDGDQQKRRASSAPDERLALVREQRRPLRTGTGCRTA